MCKILTIAIITWKERWHKVGDSIKDRLTIFQVLVDYASGKPRYNLAYSALLLIIVIAFTIRILALSWENLSEGTALLNEFDPYYQFSITKHMVDNGSPFTLLPDTLD